MSTKHTSGTQQFEHDGFNSPNEIDMARRRNTVAPSKAECALAASLVSINSVKVHMRALQQRFRIIENVPGGRSLLLPAERIEYDSIGALLSDLRDAIAKATGE